MEVVWFGFETLHECKVQCNAKRQERKRVRKKGCKRSTPKSESHKHAPQLVNERKQNAIQIHASEHSITTTSKAALTVHRLHCTSMGFAQNETTAQDFELDWANIQTRERHTTRVHTTQNNTIILHLRSHTFTTIGTKSIGTGRSGRGGRSGPMSFLSTKDSGNMFTKFRCIGGF